MTETPAPAPAPAATAAPAAPQFSAGAARAKTVPLQFPLDYDGKHYAAIAIRRMSAQDVADYIATVERAATPDTLVRFPLYYHEDGTRVPDAVLDAIDADDSEEVQRAGLDFLPRSFRPISQPDSVSVPANGGPTAPQSGA